MKKLFLVMLAAVLVVSTAFVTGTGSKVVASEPKIMDFDTMVGVPRPYTGSANAIRGVPGGGLPWVIGTAKGKLRANGKLEVKVRGLVFDPNDPTVIERGLANQNPVAFFKAIVSCLSVDSSGNPITVNVSTGNFPATTGLGAGDADIEAQLSLPSPCIAPIIFVTNPGGAWFAATGF